MNNISQKMFQKTAVIPHLCPVKRRDILLHVLLSVSLLMESFRKWLPHLKDNFKKRFSVFLKQLRAAIFSKQKSNRRIEGSYKGLFSAA